MTIENNENKYKELLEVGQEFKNYRELCRYLDEEIKSGKSKQLQEKEWNRYFLFTKKGHKIIISEIFEEFLPKIDLREKGNRTIETPLLETHPTLTSEWIVIKNGMLSDSITRTTKERYWWKCSMCQKEIFQSPFSRVKHPISNTNISCEYCSLSEVAKLIYTFLQNNKIKFKMEYMFDDLRGLSNGHLRFDFAVPDKNGEIHTLIEYDGEYHDETNGYTTVLDHDELKNDYCKINNIPLLRIHHTESSVYRELIYSHFKELGLELLIKDDYFQTDSDTIDRWKYDIEKLERKIEHLQLKVEVWS